MSFKLVRFLHLYILPVVDLGIWTRSGQLRP